MKDFEFTAPVKIHFGRSAIYQLSSICDGHKVMLVYGGKSIKESGVYQHIIEILNKRGIRFIDFPDNKRASYQKIIEGIKLCRQESVDCVVGIGGGTCMDMAKVIAFGAINDNLSEYLSKKLDAKNKKRLLTILIPTYPSTGSEMNNISDVLDFEGGHGRLRDTFADHAILNPEFTFSLDKRNSAYSALVSFIQATVFYFDNTNELARGFTKVILKTFLSSYSAILKEPTNYEARGNIMWGASVTTMGLLSSGMICRYPWGVYSLTSTVNSLIGTSYRESLVIVFPRWIRKIAEVHQDEVCRYFTEIFDINKTLEKEEILNLGCQRLFQLLEDGGLALHFGHEVFIPKKADVELAVDSLTETDLSIENMREIILDCFTTRNQHHLNE